MYNTGSFFGRHKITDNHTESISLLRLGIGHELMIAPAFHLAACEPAGNVVWDLFIILPEFLQLVFRLYLKVSVLLAEI